MKKIAFMILCLLASFNSKAMELGAVLVDEAAQDLAANQRKVTPALLGDAFLDSDGDRIQARVFNQFSMSGGNASCGYQALHNALVLSKLLFSKDQPEQAALQKALSEKREKETLFGSDDAPWRKNIIAQRDAYSHTDWLENIEIQKLSEKFVIPELKGLSHFFVLGDIPWKDPLKSDIQSFEDYDEQDETKVNSNFRNFMKLYHTLDKNCLGIFIMYDGEPTLITKTCDWLTSIIFAEDQNSLTKTNTNGHWHCIVVNKVNNEVQFILADSNSNASRLQDKRLNELIALLERRPSVELQVTTQNNLFSSRTVVVCLILAALVGAIAKKKLTKTSSTKMLAHLQDIGTEEHEEI